MGETEQAPTAQILGGNRIWIVFALRQSFLPCSPLFLPLLLKSIGRYALSLSKRQAAGGEKAGDGQS